MVHTQTDTVIPPELFDQTLRSATALLKHLYKSQGYDVKIVVTDLPVSQLRKLEAKRHKFAKLT